LSLYPPSFSQRLQTIDKYICWFLVLFVYFAEEISHQVCLASIGVLQKLMRETSNFGENIGNR
jgi:hypothetical protein